MADEENGIKIDSGELISVLECSVCCSEYSDPALTKCGHTFCRACIEECINCNHECPECKHTLAKDDLMKNIQVDRVQRQIHDLHAKAKNEIVENIIALEGSMMKSPVVPLFQANFKDSLVRFERYCDDARRELEDVKKKIKARCSGMLKLCGDPAKQLAIAQEESRESAEAETRYKLAMDFLLRLYDKYMREALPEPAALPVKMSIRVPSKGLRLDNVHIKPAGQMREVRLIVEKHFIEKLGNPVIKWGLDAHYVIMDPLTDDAKEGGIIVPITEEMRLVSDFRVYPGSVVELRGTATCESDVPKPCITLKFRKEEKKMYNYYSCETCGMNWICEPCVQQCHQGHTTKEYLRGHVPAWACCYCTKKGCTLPNKNNPLGNNMAMSQP